MTDAGRAEGPLTLTDAEETDLEWILNVEDTAVQGGFVSGDSAINHQRQMADQSCLYMIAKRGDEPVGYVILRGILGGEPVVELKRIVITKTEAGHGQGVMGLLMHKVFDDIGAHRLWLDVADHNERAQHVYRKLGFVEEGRLRSAARRKGDWHDLVLFGMLKSEWQGD